jgi:signal transduction histidine kinase
MEARVPAVLEVLRGRPTAEVAARYGVDAEALAGWVRSFVEAGTAAVTDQRSVDSAELRDRYLAAFAHEVRMPLSMTLGWVATLADGGVPPEQARDSLTRLHGALDRLAERALDVALLAELSLGRLALAPQLVPVSAVVQGLDGLEAVEGLGADEEVVVDPALLRRVLRDLWQVAGSAPAPRGRRLETRQVGDWLELRVHRDGPPLEPAALRVLFEPFGLNDDGSGVRVGLHLAQLLAAAHGGGIGSGDDGAALWVRVPAQTS